MNIEIIKNFNDDSRGRWQQLSCYDKTIITLDYESILVNYFMAEQAVAFIVANNGEPLLRTLLSPIDAEAGIFALGFFAFDPITDGRLLQAAFTELLGQVHKFLEPAAVTKIVAPMNGATLFNYRIRTDDEPHSFRWEPSRQPELLERLLETGFKTDTIYHTYMSTPFSKLLSDSLPAARRAVAGGYRVSNVDPCNLSKDSLYAFYQLIDHAFSENSYYRSISPEFFAAIYLAEKNDLSYQTVVVQDTADRYVGFGFTFLEPDIDALVIKTGAVARSARRSGLIHAIIHHVADNMLERIPQNYVTALVRSGLGSESIPRHGETLWKHQYQLLSWEPASF